ncbi:MAG: (d)CMP kinase [Candidatus Auribacterota bacterium]|nr:(d)CMP kinase [Candidatus Auribacterota bacterium]
MKTDKNLVITIDGLAYVGKTTISRDLAKLLGYKFISTGWIYRCLALKVLREGIDINNEKKVVELSEKIEINIVPGDADFRVISDGIDITEEIYTPLIVSATSTVSAYSGVRKNLLSIQKQLGEQGGVVMEGRDMGTVVFPNADWKFYVHASFEVRLKRLFKLLTDEEKVKYPTPESSAKQLQAIDERDLNRDAAPVKIPEDAIIYDNTDSPSSMQDAHILQYYITHKEEIIKNSSRWAERK